jgi:hypothetical protein
MSAQSEHAQYFLSSIVDMASESLDKGFIQQDSLQVTKQFHDMFH